MRHMSEPEQRKGVVPDDAKAGHDKAQPVDVPRCPECGQRLRAMTGAERQRLWRERQKVK